jgi:choline dehydrogenase-like flavoprotein
MLVDARHLADGTTIDADVCIVGAGPAGLTLARELIDTRLTVCLLESGGREPDAATQALDAGENVGYPYYPLHTARSRSLGGSSVLWHVPREGEDVGARMRPLDPIDFEQREWIAYSGWPFGYDHLEPYYRRAQAVCRIEPASYDPGSWTEATRRPLPLGDDVQTILYKIAPRDLFVRVYPEEVGRADNITTYLHASVLEIETHESGDRATHVRVATRLGNRFRVRATMFVLAAGGIETPRLLLLSRSTHPEGLGNRHDLVGRFFMEHPHFWSGVVVPGDPAIFERTAFYNDIHLVNRVAVVGKLALSDATLRRERLLNQNVQLMPVHRPDPFRYRTLDAAPIVAAKAMARGHITPSHARRVVGGWRDIGAVVFRKLRPAPATRVFVLANMTEQVPNRDSRVMLGSECDPFGQPHVRLDWRIAPQDVRSAVRTQEILGAALERAGIGRLHRDLLDDTPPPGTHGGYHHMGTTRMHVDPSQGVVDADCRVHGMANVYIAGSSVFPTGGYANPVLTTIALTLRLADHVKARLERAAAA